MNHSRMLAPFELFLLIGLLRLSVSTSQTSKNCSHTTLSQDESPVYSRDFMSHHDAKNWIRGQCESGRLYACGSLENSTQDEQLHGSRVWLGFTRERIPWQWVNGTHAESNPFERKRKHRKRHTHNERCALLHAGEGRIISFHCLTKEPAALCQLPANRICNAGTSLCEEIKGSCFCVLESHHWYHARAACEGIRGRLAILPDESFRKDISQVMKKKPPKLTINWVWIGLHGEDWFEMSGPRKGQPAESTALFAPGEENDERKNCAVASTAASGEMWYAVNCNETHKVLGICGSDQNQNMTDPTSDTAEGPKDHTQQNSVVRSTSSVAHGSAVVSTQTFVIILLTCAWAF